MNSCLYNFFDNSTIASIIAISIGAVIASWQYIRQKRVDRRISREKEIIENLILLNEKINYSLFILNRMVNTKNLIDSENKVKTFLEALEKHEIPRLSNALNEDIPYLDMKIAFLLDLYFKENSEVKIAHEKYKANLKEWHDFVIKEIPEPKFGFDKKTSEIPELSIVILEQSIEDLIEAISKN